jgi:hypothetical protein
MITFTATNRSTIIFPAYLRSKFNAKSESGLGTCCSEDFRGFISVSVKQYSSNFKSFRGHVFTCLWTEHLKTFSIASLDDEEPR